MWTIQRDGDDWKVIDPQGKTWMEKESYAICSNIADACNSRRFPGECGEVARNILAAYEKQRPN